MKRTTSTTICIIKKQLHARYYIQGKRITKALGLYTDANAIGGVNPEIMEQANEKAANILTSIIGDREATNGISAAIHGKAEHTRKAYLTVWNAFRGVTGCTTMKEATTEQLMHYISTIQDKAPATIKLHYSVLHKAATEVDNEGIFTKSVKRLLPALKTLHKKTPLTAAELESLANTPCRSETIRRAFLFACITGLRYSDVKSLTPDNISADNGIYWLEKKQVKTGGVIYRPLQQEAVELLHDNTGRFGFQLPDATTTNRELNRWSKSAGINHPVTFHTARHTAVTNWANNENIGLYLAMKLAGHKSIKTTLLYSHQDKSKMLQALGINY